MRAVIGQVDLARLAPGYGNKVVIGQQQKRNVVRSLAAVSGEARCVTTLKTAARETTNQPAISHNQKVNTRDIFNSLVKKTYSLHEVSCYFLHKFQ